MTIEKKKKIQIYADLLLLNELEKLAKEHSLSISALSLELIRRGLLSLQKEREVEKISSEINTIRDEIELQNQEISRVFSVIKRGLLIDLTTQKFSLEIAKKVLSNTEMKEVNSMIENGANDALSKQLNIALKSKE